MIISAEDTDFADAQPVRLPSWSFMREHPAHLIALGGGCGLAWIAPGTVGTLLAFPLYWVFASYYAAPGLLIIITVLFAVGVWACARTGRALGMADAGCIVWDEVVAFMLVLVFTPPGHGWQASAFLLFRFFDIVKPPPIRYFDALLKSGFGVMFDDVLAAFYTLLVLAASAALMGIG